MRAMPALPLSPISDAALAARATPRIRELIRACDGYVITHGALPSISLLCELGECSNRGYAVKAIHEWEDLRGAEVTIAEADTHHGERAVVLRADRVANGPIAEQPPHRPPDQLPAGHIPEGHLMQLLREIRDRENRVEQLLEDRLKEAQESTRRLEVVAARATAQRNVAAIACSVLATAGIAWVLVGGLARSGEGGAVPITQSAPIAEIPVASSASAADSHQTLANRDSELPIDASTTAALIEIPR